MKLIIQMNGKRNFEITDDQPHTNFLRSIEAARKNNQFFVHGNFHINPNEISWIEIVEAQLPVQPGAPIKPDTRTLEEKQLEKQPMLKNYTNVYNG